jgi:glucose-6-phosphate isomerase
MHDLAGTKVPENLEPSVGAALARLEQQNYRQRLWARDPTVWKDDASHRRIIENALGWLDSPVVMRDQAADHLEFARRMAAQGFRHAVVLGMGGSSLCPDICRLTFGSAAGFLELHVLDSTVPASVATLAGEVDVPNTLFLVSSKSGGTIEPLSFFRYFYDVVRRHKGIAAGENFIAITDPGTMLEGLAREKGFRHIFPGQPDIGGRFSALSNFGMVPAALAGVDIVTLLDRALAMRAACAADVPLSQNPGAVLGALLAEAAQAGRNKVTFVMSAGIHSFGDWVEQLIAESTGKEGKGLLPVVKEYIATPEVYGSDRVFIRMALVAEKKKMVEDRLDALAVAGHPVLRIDLNDPYDLGHEFFRWEVATATAGALMGIDPFDQPNVQQSKDLTNRLLSKFRATGKLPEPEPALQGGGVKVYCSSGTAGSGAVTAQEGADCLADFLNRARSGSYVALLPYLEARSTQKASIQALRLLLRDHLKLATTVGYGPRYLHSTGQLHKGGPPQGLFILLTSDDEQDCPVPGEPFSFAVLKQAQALGDYEALKSKGLPVLRFHLSSRVEEGLDQVTGWIQAALRKISTPKR